MARQLETAARWRNKSQLQAATAAAAAVNLQPTLASFPPPLSSYTCLLHCWLSLFVSPSVCLSPSSSPSPSSSVCLSPGVVFCLCLPLRKLKSLCALRVLRDSITKSDSHHLPNMPPPPFSRAVFCCNYFPASPASFLPLSASCFPIFQFGFYTFLCFCDFSRLALWQTKNTLN